MIFLLSSWSKSEGSSRGALRNVEHMGLGNWLWRVMFIRMCELWPEVPSHYYVRVILNLKASPRYIAQWGSSELHCSALRLFSLCYWKLPAVSPSAHLPPSCCAPFLSGSFQHLTPHRLQGLQDRTMFPLETSGQVKPMACCTWERWSLSRWMLLRVCALLLLVMLPYTSPKS